MAGKRAHGEGYVTQTPSGKWRGQLMDGNDPVTGKRIIRSFTAPTKREVLQMIRDYKEQKLHPPEPAPILFQDWADQWYRDYQTQVEVSTYANYKYTLKSLKDRFGQTPLTDLLPLEINRYLTQLLEQGCSHSKISKCRAMLIQIMDSAVANSLLDRNPARAAKAIRMEAVTGDLHSKPKDAFTPGEVERLLAELPDTPVGNGIRLLLGTGMRVQELVALTAEDIAEDGSWVSVSKAVKMVDSTPVLGPPKSRRSVRTIPVAPRYRPYAIALRNSAGKLFCIRSHKPGEPCTIESFRKQYIALLSKLPGIRRLTPHCCRHTYITTLQVRGVPMETIARLVGHSRITTTDGYLHIPDSALADAVQVLEATSSETEVGA